MVGSPVRRAGPVWGGHGPSAMFRLFLEDGRTLLAKGAGAGSIPENWTALALEEAAYRDVGAVAGIAPGFLGSGATESWHLLLLEDLRHAALVRRAGGPGDARHRPASRRRAGRGRRQATAAAGRMEVTWALDFACP